MTNYLIIEVSRLDYLKVLNFVPKEAISSRACYDNAVNIFDGIKKIINHLKH